MQRRELNDAEKRDWLRLARTENIGPITFRQLLVRYGSAAAALETLPNIAIRGGRRDFRIPSISAVEDEIAQVKKNGGTIIAMCEAAYPEALAAIEDAPPLITALGKTSLLQRRSIGIVGARNASINGRKMTETLARELGGEGIVVVSGLARGVDTAAHQASLATGTVAVLAGGVDAVYPEENRDLYERIIEKGCVISDQPFGCEPHARLFPRRNRLISGLSLGVIVVEAAMQSGSLITARMALEQGREVFAVPGSPLDPRSAGANDLIRQGAVLVEKTHDVLDHIHEVPRGLAEPPIPALEFMSPLPDESELSTARMAILDYLSPSPTSVDDLVRQSGLSAAVVLTVLLELELAGRVERQAGHKVALVGGDSGMDSASPEARAISA